MKRLDNDLPGLKIHVSTMMNVLSSPFVDFLKSLGVTRIITSRDVSLAQAKEMARRTGLEMEYFIHGDMCSVQSGLCLLIGILFGQSSNRGRCLKPCRWPWKITLENGEALSDEEAPADANDLSRASMKYHLARKDMCLFHALPAVVESGITSLKIEGRMRPTDYLEKVVGVYRRALDRYMEAPFQYEEDASDAAILHKEKTRDFTTCHAFGQPGPASIDPSGAREPKFFSTPDSLPKVTAAHLKPDPLPADNSNTISPTTPIYDNRKYRPISLAFIENPSRTDMDIMKNQAEIPLMDGPRLLSPLTVYLTQVWKIGNA